MLKDYGFENIKENKKDLYNECLVYFTPIDWPTIFGMLCGIIISVINILIEIKI